MSKIKVKGFKVKQDNNRFSQDTYVLGPVNIEDGNATGSVKTIGVNQNYTLGEYAFAEGFQTQALGANSHTEGRGTTTQVGGIAAHAEGNATVASGANSHAEGDSTTASRAGSHAEGRDTTASSQYSHAEGRDTTASGRASHAEGNGATASGLYSHAEGNGAASGSYSHAEGNGAASGSYSHAEGEFSTASEANAHAEGVASVASGQASHAEGGGSVASGRYSHAQNIETIAASDFQTALGKYNVEDSNDTYAIIVGNGTRPSARSNALAVDWNGNIITNGQLINQQGNSIYNNNLKNLIDGSTEGSLRSIGSAEEQDKIQIISDPVSGRSHGSITINIDISTIPDSQEIRDNLIISVDIYETTDANIFTEVNNNDGEPYAWEITDDQLTFIYNGVHVEEESEDKDIYIKVKVEVPDNYVYHLGQNAFTEGQNTKASGDYSHAQNHGTIAASDNQTALGKYNIEDSNNEYAVIIGNGTTDNARSNALTVDWDGTLSVGAKNKYNNKTGCLINADGTITLQAVTSESNAYGTAKPYIEFLNGNSLENIQLIFTDWNSIGGSASLTLAGNQGGEYFIAPNIKATGNFYGNLTGNATTASYLQGLSSRDTIANWGNQNGTVLSCYGTPNNGGWVLREYNNAMNMIIDGHYYQNEGNNLVLDTSNYVNYVSQVRDASNGTATKFQYSGDGMNYANYSWLAAWDGYTLRAVNKAQFAQASHTHSVCAIRKITYTGSSALPNNSATIINPSVPVVSTYIPVGFVSISSNLDIDGFGMNGNISVFNNTAFVYLTNRTGASATPSVVGYVLYIQNSFLNQS